MNTKLIPHNVLPSGTTRKTLNELIEEGNLVEKAIETLRAGLTATRKFWSPVSKTWIEEPVWQPRLEAAKSLLAYAVGEPVARSITVNTSNDDFRTLRDIMIQAADRSEVVKNALEMTSE